MINILIWVPLLKINQTFLVRGKNNFGKIAFDEIKNFLETFNPLTKEELFFGWNKFRVEAGETENNHIC